MNSFLARVLIIVAVAVIPTLALQAYSESEGRQARRQLVEEDALRLVRLVSAEQQRIIEGAEQMLTVVGLAPYVLDGIPSCTLYLSDLETTMPRYGGVAVVGSDGHPLCAPERHDPTAGLSDQPLVSEGAQDRQFRCRGVRAWP